jgi:NAD(P)-dependent dehydrogenase (short-subunit alcohol dehydrogenase family)
MMSNELANKRVVVTGGAGFLGQAVVRALLDAGANVEATWHAESEQKHLLAATDRLHLHRLEVSDEAAVSAFFAGLPDLWGSVHTVGAFAMSPVAQTSVADVRKMFDTNAMTCFLCCREATKAIRRSGVAGGRIVNVAARPAVMPVGGMIAYSISKAAVASITQSLAEELKPEGIWVNAVAPSLMDTAANRKAMPDADYSQWPKVEEVAAAIAFLASPVNALTSGAIVPVYGRV